MKTFSRKLRILVISIGVIIVCDCSKNNSVTTQRLSKLVAQPVQGGIDTTILTYDANNELVKYESHYPGGATGPYFQLNYTNQQVQSVEEFYTSIPPQLFWYANVFVNNQHQIAGAVLQTGTGVNSDSLKFYYNGAGNPVELEDIYLDGSPTIAIYRFDWDSQNLSRVSISDSNTVDHSVNFMESIDYTYDNKRNPYYHLVLNLLLNTTSLNACIYFSQNNPLTENIHSVYNGEIDISNTYQYTENNYPSLKTITTTSTGYNSVVTLQYFYENL